VNPAATTFLVIAVLLAVTDWVAVGRGDRRLEHVAKPGATLALIGVAATLDPADPAARVLFVGALLASLVGDVLLMGPGERFVAGLAAFLVAQLLYIVGFAIQGASAAGYAVGLLLAAVLIVPLGTRFMRALRASGRDALVGPVGAYMTAIGPMYASAVASADAAAIIGALAFVASDGLIAETRFVAPLEWGPVAIMVTYHVAQLGLVLSLL
jgi:uncharacterized membrane protein YhhN